MLVKWFGKIFVRLMWYSRHYHKLLNIVHLFCGSWEYTPRMQNFGKGFHIQTEHSMVIFPWPSNIYAYAMMEQNI